MTAPLRADSLVEKVKECTACGACLVSCPTNSIHMDKDTEGFLRPYIDEETCISCHKCIKVCPVIQNNTIELLEVKLPKTYAGVHKRTDVLDKSSSGGVFTAIAETIINDGGVVCGAVYNQDFQIIHSITDKLEGIAPMRGSKYAPGLAYNVFNEIRNILKSGRKVLFTGLPCQVVGLKAYLGKQKYAENLITCDIICHGMVSHTLYNGFLSSLKKRNKELANINFRQKVTSGTVLRVTYSDGSCEDIPFEKNHYYHILLSDNCLRKSCYNCIARKGVRQSDITIGDFWGIKRVLPELDEKKGVSVIFLHTVKADEIVSRITGDMELKQTPFAYSVYENSSYWISPDYYPSRDKFIHYLLKHGYSKTVKHYYQRNIVKRLVYSLGRLIFNLLRNFSKK